MAFWCTAECINDVFNLDLADLLTHVARFNNQLFPGYICSRSSFYSNPCSLSPKALCYPKALFNDPCEVEEGLVLVPGANTAPLYDQF